MGQWDAVQRCLQKGRQEASFPRDENAHGVGSQLKSTKDCGTLITGLAMDTPLWVQAGQVYASLAVVGGVFYTGDWPSLVTPNLWEHFEWALLPDSEILKFPPSTQIPLIEPPRSEVRGSSRGG